MNLPSMQRGTRRAMPPRARAALALVFCFAACSRATAPKAEPEAAAPASPTKAEGAPAPGESCPARIPAKLPLPGVSAAETTLDYWLARYDASELDAVLLGREDIATYDADIGRRPGREVYSQRDLRVPVDALVLAAELQERLGVMRGELEAKSLVDARGNALDAASLAPFAPSTPVLAPTLRVVLRSAPVRCGPYPGALYKLPLPIVPTYDKNACGTLRAQEPVEVLAEPAAGERGMRLVRSRYSLGWIDGDAALSQPLTAVQAEAWVHGGHVSLPADTQLQTKSGATLTLEKHTRLPLADDGRALLATSDGIERIPPPSAATPTARELTRRALLTEAFRFTDSAYGLGDANGGRDCSGFLLDLFDTFDLALPRHSGWQAEAGSYAIDLSGASEAEKLRRLDLVSHSGAVLLFFPGHIMLYLGKNEHGVPMALHALGEYALPCSGGGESIVDVQHTVVSTLELGRGSSRKSFLERITRLVVFGRAPPPELAQQLVARPPEPPRPLEAKAPCSDSNETRLFVSPAVPLQNVALRVIAVSTKPIGNASLRVFDDTGASLPIDLLHLGGPPYGVVARAPYPQPGRYTAVLGEGSRVLACKRLRVRDAPMAAVETPADAPIWQPRWRWERDTEALWAVFVERLFDGPPDDEQTWTSLHALLRDPNRNLLYDHLGLGEEDKLEIEPDCADLPYSLRAYFAWKLRLPYAYRACSRGRLHEPPTCSEMHTPLELRTTPDEIETFSKFVNGGVRQLVHSATG
ncbi:MAG TPA: NlpC/P60 family protein, partial [Polyangiales bacterium]|nr:NlpC/P60 family protein [Polyangiales bacterium]